MTAGHARGAPLGEHAPLSDSDAFGETTEVGLPHEARVALATLLTQRFITRENHPAAWDGLLAFESEIRERLGDLFMTLTLDRDHEVAFKRQVLEDAVPVLLRREKPLSRDASFVLILLRQEHAYTDALDDAVVVTRDQISDFLNRFSQDNSADQVTLERRVDAAIRAVEALGLLEADADSSNNFVVSPAIVPLVGTDVLGHLRTVYENATPGDSPMEASDE